MNAAQHLPTNERTRRILEDLEAVRENLLLHESFTYKRPHGFVLDGQATIGITTWKRLFELVCRQLYQRSPDRFRALIDHPEFISNRGNRSVTRDPAALRGALAVADGIFIECNLSANGIRDMLIRLLAAYEIPTDRMQLFLREDRDAGREVA